MAPPTRNDPAQHERFARGLASGWSARRAAAAAGFSTTSGYPPRLAKKPEIQALVARLVAEKSFTGPDLAPVIEALMRGAEKAMSEGKVGGYGAAARMLAEAGRLKQKLPPYVDEAAELEWLRRWGPEN